MHLCLFQPNVAWCYFRFAEQQHVSMQTLLPRGKCLQVVTKPICLDGILLQWVCADFCAVIWPSEMQLGSIPQWTSVLVSLLVSGSFPASALILVGLNLMSTTLSFPSPFFFFSLSLHNALSLLSLPSFSPPLFCLCLRFTVSSRGHEEGRMELHCSFKLQLYV